MTPRTHRHRASSCPYCGHALDTSTSMRGGEAPDPGDVTLCIACAGLLIYDRDLALRFPTDEELLAVANHPDVVTMRLAVLHALGAEPS